MAQAKKKSSTKTKSSAKKSPAKKTVVKKAAVKKVAKVSAPTNSNHKTGAKSGPKKNMTLLWLLVGLSVLLYGIALARLSQGY
jgi:hypothetical protein